MVEVHGWITIRETYEAIDEKNFDEILKLIDVEIKKLKYCNPQIVRINGECFIELFPILFFYKPVWFYAF